MSFEIGGQAAHILSKPFIHDDINSFQRNCRANRMARCCEPMREFLNRFRSRLQTLGQLRAKNDRPHGEISSCEVFGADDGIRNKPIGLATPGMACATESTNDLIGYQRDAIFFQNGL